MSTINTQKNFQTYMDEYAVWQDQNKLRDAKRQEFLRRNPDAIKDYDVQRSRRLLKAVDIMDKSISKNSNHVDTAFESAVDIGLGYAAIGGTALGFLFSKLGFVKKFIDKITKNNPKSKNIISMAITAISGVVGIVAAFPIYKILTDIESKIHRKRKFETMEQELQDPKIFAVLDSNQKENYKNNVNNIEKTKNKFSPTKIIGNKLEYFKQITNEAIFYDKKQNEFRKKYEEDTSLYNKELTQKEIKDAKKDRELLTNLIKNLNRSAQSYKEKMERITDNLITMSFALGSLFTLGYERIAKSLKLKSSALPAGIGVFLMIGSTFFATWAQKRASHVGRFKAKQDLMQNPEKLVYISSSKTNTIKDDELEINIDNNKKVLKPRNIDFLKEFFQNNKEYKEWKKTETLSGKDISKALEDIELSDEQIKDGKRLQKNMFKTFYKVDSNTQKYSGKIDIMSETIKYPISLVLGTIGSVWGMKHLANLRSAVNPKDIFKNTAKYIGTILLFTIPSLLANSYFAKAQKMGARVSDMMTMKELEDYRFFADYSRFTEEKSSP